MIARLAQSWLKRGAPLLPGAHGRLVAISLARAGAVIGAVRGLVCRASSRIKVSRHGSKP